MDIEDAFTEEAITSTDTNVGGDEENQLRKMIKQLYAANKMDQTPDDENLAVLCFVAGRAYQTQFNDVEIPVYMNTGTINAFVEFLVQRGAT